MDFVDVKNDIAFRKIFGNESKKIILISFLNAVLKLEDKNRIESVEILNPYQLPIIQNLKASIIDIRARDGMERSFIVEMQVTEPSGLDKRLLYYASKEYSSQILVGDKYTQLKPVIFIGIFNFNFTKGPKFLSHHGICDTESGERVIDDMDFFFIELPKFTKSADQLESITDKWIFFIKEAENLHTVPENADDAGLVEAYHDANRQSWTKEELDAYIYAGMREQDARGVVELAVERAKEDVAMKGINMGMQLEVIAEISGLTLKQVLALSERQ